MLHIGQLETTQQGVLHTGKKTFRKMLEDFKASMKRAFHGENEIDRFFNTGDYHLPDLKELMSGNPLSLCIPKEYGGFGGGVKENMVFITEASYESLALSLTLGSITVSSFSRLPNTVRKSES